MHESAGADHSDHRARLMEQVERADEIMRDKDRTLQQLEEKLHQQSNIRERAEVRCGAAIQVRGRGLLVGL